MNLISVYIISLGFCILQNTNAAADNKCAEVAVSPPDPKSGCCGRDTAPDSKIISSIVDISEYPWLALIEYDKKGKTETLCGGALISAKYVLTGAQCVVGHVLAIATPTHIRLGEYNKSHDGPDCVEGEAGSVDCTEGEIRIPIEKLIPHAEFNTGRSKSNDIALIRMKESAPYTDFIRPICLPTEDVTLKNEPITFRLASWETSRGPSSVKIFVDLPLVKNDICQSAYSSGSRKTTLVKGQLCAGGEKGFDSCKGDSGMPLVYKNGHVYEVIGITSYGLRQCGTENVPSVYTSVYQYSSWIASNITP